jgi:PKD repeat protein
MRELASSLVAGLFWLVICAATTANLAFPDTVRASELSGPGQPTSQQLEALPWLKSHFEPDLPLLHYPSRKPGHYSREDWAAAIDSTWGSGAPMGEQMAVYREFWFLIDSIFACFQDLGHDWDSVFLENNFEIVTNPSRGRFAAMLNHSAMALMESHTFCQDNAVSNSARAPGVPLMSIGGWNANHHFGAALTPLADSSLLVYLAIDPHPLGLVRGDVVLGYDGTPWKEIYLELLEAQLPIYHGGWPGSSEVSFTHSLLMAAGLNWHLFDTIDIVKYETGDTLHLPTNLLVDQVMVCYGTEQMPLPGIDTPTWSDPVSWGIVEGTNIGYIGCMVWVEPAGEQLLNAVDSLMFHHETIGLIIDFRFNYGGNMFLAYDALELLFNTYTETIGFAQRCDPNNRDSMCVTVPPEGYAIDADPDTYFDRPIALLTGPGAVSSGDQVALAMTFHPEVRTFGKPTAAAFNTATQASPGSGYSMQYAYGDAWPASDPGHYLTHDVIPVDEDVWLTPDGVAQGMDDVVGAAINWIFREMPVFFFTDSSFGQAPFEMTFTGWSPFDATDWMWDFGDGDSAFVLEPTHVFAERGIYDITVAAVVDGQTHSYTDSAAVVVLADTLRADSVAVTEADSVIEVRIRATNTIPLNRLTIPLEYSGTLALVYDSFSTAGCRTEYFDIQTLIHISSTLSRTTIKLQTASDNSQPDLPADSGLVLKVFFHVNEAASPGQQATLSLDGYTNYDPIFVSPRTEYLARGADGLAYFTTCCLGIAGNVDDDAGDVIDIADLVYLVDYMFDFGPAPLCLYEANIDGDSLNMINISDLVYLVDYMFTGGPEPVPCP